LSMGRTDRLQSHIAMSQFLWPAAAAALAICGAITWWVVSATPADLTRIGAQPLNAEWALVGGPALHRGDYRAAFLLNADSGAYERIDGRVAAAIPTADGSALLIFKPMTFGSKSLEVLRRDVRIGAPEVPTGLTIAHLSMDRFAMTNDANRIAYATGDVINVYDVPQQRSLGSFRMPGLRLVSFVSPDLLRIDTTIGSSIAVYEYDVRRHVLRQTGAYVSTTPLKRLRLFRDLIGIYADNGSTTLLDAQTARPVVTEPGRVLTILSDHRVVWGRPGNMVVVGDRVITLGRVDVWFAREVAPGKVLVAGQPPGSARRGWQLSVIDADHGTVIRRVADLEPAFLYGPTAIVTRAAPPTSSMLVHDAHGSLLRWNALTGETKLILTPAQ
jgi:hypothetical protein